MISPFSFTRARRAPASIDESATVAKAGSSEGTELSTGFVCEGRDWCGLEERVSGLTEEPEGTRAPGADQRREDEQSREWVCPGWEATEADDCDLARDGADEERPQDGMGEDAAVERLEPELEDAPVEDGEHKQDRGRPVQRWISRIRGGGGQGSLRNIQAAVRSWKQARPSATIESQVIRWNWLEKKRVKLPLCS